MSRAEENCLDESLKTKLLVIRLMIPIEDILEKVLEKNP